MQQLIFFDTEFTDLKQNAELISIGLITMSGEKLYLQCRYNENKVSAFVKEHVAPYMDPNVPRFTKETTRSVLSAWLAQQYEASGGKEIIMVSDCYAYDWMLFCNLFGGAMGIPRFVYYIPLDLSTALYMKGVDPDINRIEYSGIEPGNIKQHNALDDAIVIRACWKKLMEV